jgi:hypothetical protein
LLLGVLAALTFRVSWDTDGGHLVSQAGWPYAAIWVAVSAARIWFTWGASHVFGPGLGRTGLLAARARAATTRAAEPAPQVS